MSASQPTPRPPRGLDAITADATLGPAARCDEHLGVTLRCLAATRLGGVILQLGGGSVALAAWLVDGMDITSRLLLLVDAPGRVEPARAHVGNDIRVAVHCQAPVEFMADVARNRMDMVVIDDGRSDPALLDAAAGLLNPGGMLVVLDAAGGRPDLATPATHLATRGDCLVAPLETTPPLLVAVRTPEESRPVRRGGRSARQAAGRTPVANLR